MKRFPLIYAAWIALCAVLFVGLRSAEDPSRRGDRILNNDAAARAEAILTADARYRGYEVVHVAYANRGEGGTEARWVVLLDRVPHSALHEARVVELRAKDGTLLVVRAPRP
ncbi:MAG TPA: hypothetical protein VH087_01090 [Thermoanaerobaculia bacterium]|nr:hypothetical protein [Thermoanaerobaculia bacterium]